MLCIAAEADKGFKDRLLPLAPEAAEFLLSTPEEARSGRVFDPIPRRRLGGRLSLEAVSRAISAIGEAAKVTEANRRGKRGVKWASAHDLRRSFGVRWAARVMPAILQQLMRHESIETELRYDVGRDAETTADVIWSAIEPPAGDTSGDTRPESGKSVAVNR